MSAVVLSGDTSGAVTITAPAVAGTPTLTLPTTTDTLVGKATTDTLTNKTLTSPTISTINLTGGQIAFPATQSASADANTLDDYEEGTWTPTYYGSSTAGTTTYTQQRGTYTKVGRLVTIDCDLTWSAKTGTGNGRVGGLPFTPAFPIDSRGLFFIAAYNGYSITSNYLTGLVEQNSTFIVLYTLSSSGTLGDSAVTTGEIRFQMSYIAS